MFSNLSRGSILYGLDNKDGVKLFTAAVDFVTPPYPRNAQTTFGQLPEMVVDIKVNIDGENKEFKQVPSNNVIADFGPNTIVISDSKDSLIHYVKSLRQTSKNIIDSYQKHKALIPKYDDILSNLNPEHMNEAAVKDLKEQVNTLQAQLAEAISLIKSTNK